MDPKCLISNKNKRKIYSDNAIKNMDKFRLKNIVQAWRDLLGEC